MIDLRCGDAMGVLQILKDDSIQCCITSPPYWGLRDYGTGTWEGGNTGCSHVVGGQVQDTKAPGAITTGVRPGVDASCCRKCGARRVDAQLGLERTPEEYVSRLVEVFREVRRVLRQDGTLWLNLGDSYWGGKGENGSSKARATASERGYIQSGGTVQMSKRPQDGKHVTLKPKDIVGIPWRVAFALQADGWWLRSDIIWSKPNPMPESVTDRPTKAHEYLFLLAKEERYYYDAEAISEPVTNSTVERLSQPTLATQAGSDRVPFKTNGPMRAVGTTTTRNRRSVWTVATQPFKGAHFAVMPEKLVEPCVLAGSCEGDTVLDPFCGSGTVGAVCIRTGRSFVGIDLNSEYIEMARNRISSVAPLFNAEIEE